MFLTGMAIPMVLMGAAALFCAKEAIAAMNATAAWDPAAPRAKRARSRRGVVYALLIIAAAVGLLLEHLAK